jgi:hypothetical protein
MTNTNKTTKLFIGMLILGVLMIGLASAANSNVCFGKGQKFKYCYELDKPRVCLSDSCQYCLGAYDSARDCYAYGGWNCKNGCTNPGTTDNTTLDLTPPMLKISSPLNSTSSAVYNKKQIFLNFSLNEIATVYYKDINKNTNMWIKVCDKCSVGSAGNPSYAKYRTFYEGTNNIMFKAVDLENNIAYVNVKFSIDSTAPRIYTTLPKASTFADGNFEVQFKEENPKRLTLTYGTDKLNLDLSKCINGTSGKKICDTSVNLSKYNGQKIPYYFEIEDIAGNKYKSHSYNISVDTKAPVVNNPTSFFKVNGHYVDFNISITEPNLDKVVFTRTNSQTTTKTTLCTKLVNGKCTKHQSFTKGNYSLSIQITDKAGHAIAIPANFKID